MVSMSAQIKSSRNFVLMLESFWEAEMMRVIYSSIDLKFSSRAVAASCKRFGFRSNPLPSRKNFYFYQEIENLIFLSI